MEKKINGNGNGKIKYQIENNNSTFSLLLRLITISQNLKTTAVTEKDFWTILGSLY